MRDDLADEPSSSEDIRKPEHDPTSDGVSESDRLNSPPEDWRELAKLPVEELEQQMAQTNSLRDRHSYLGWLEVMRSISLVRAFKEHVGGDAFHERCRRLCRIGKTAAGNIVRWGVAEPNVLAEIWERVHAEAHSASVRGERYEHPTLNKMLGWYKPDDERKASTSDDEEDDAANDQSTARQLRAQVMNLEDDAKKLTARAVIAEQRLEKTEDELAAKLTLAREQAESLALLREQHSAARAEIAAKDAEIVRLKAQIEQGDPEPDPIPDPIPDPEPDPIPDPNPEPIMVVARSLSAGEVAEVEKLYDLVKWPGKKAWNDAVIQQNRAAFFTLCPAGDPRWLERDEVFLLLVKKPKQFWVLRGDKTVDEILQEMEQ
jgi:hypothetical protein